MLLISSYMLRGQRWQLAVLVALFFVAGCTVKLYPPTPVVSNLPDGGKVNVLPDTIPDEFAFGPRIYWSQIVASDSAYSIAVTDANNKGRWLDSLRWLPGGPFVTVNGDTLATREYARDNSGVTGDNQILTYNGSGSLTIENGNTVDMSDLLDNTDDQTIDTFSLSGTTLSLSLESDGQAAQTVDLSALAVIDSTRLTQDSILVYYQDGVEVGRDTIAGTGGGGSGTDDQTLTYNGSGSLTIEDGNTVDMSDLLDNTDDQTIDTLSLSGPMLSVSLESDGQAAKTVDLSALAVIDSTRLTQDSILVYYQDGAEVGRDTIAGTGTGGGGGTITLSGDVTGSGTTTITTTIATGAVGADELASTAVTPGSYTSADITVDADGRITSAANGSGGGVVDSTRLIQDSILVYYQAGIEIGRDTITGTGVGGGGDNLGNHIMTQNLQTNGNWVSGDGGNEGIGVNAAGKVGVGTLTPSYIIDINSTDAVRLPVGTTAQRPTGTNGLLRYNSSLSRLESYYNAEWNGLSSTLANVSSNSTTTAKSLYTMTSGVPVEFRTTEGNPLLYLSGSGTRIGVNTTVAPTYFGNDPFFDALSPMIYIASNFGDSPGIAFGRKDVGTNNAVINYSPTANNMFYNISSNGSHIFYANTIPKFRINPTDVSIGTLSPASYVALGQSSHSNFTIVASGVEGTGLIMKDQYNGGIDIWHQSYFFGAGHASYFDTYLKDPDDYHYTRHIDSDTEIPVNISRFDADEFVFFPGITSGKIGINESSPTAKLHLPAGTATANTAPLKFTSGTNLTTPEAGAMEWDGTNLYITQTTGPTRKTIAYVDTASGSASGTTDGSGDITVSHTLGSASITVTATTTGTTFYHIQVHTKTSTTFKIRFFDATGAAVTATAVTADWIAKLQ